MRIFEDENGGMRIVKDEPEIVVGTGGEEVMEAPLDAEAEIEAIAEEIIGVEDVPAEIEPVAELDEALIEDKSIVEEPLPEPPIV